jgi:PDZ domain-containing protein
VTTTDAMVPDGFGAEPSPPRRQRPLLVPTVAIIVILLVSGYAIADHYTAHLFAIAPGEARPVQPYISAPPDKLHRHPGRILLVTVALLTVRPLNWITDKLNSDIQIVKEVQLTGNSPASQLNQINAVEMQTSTQTAVIVALRRLGYKVDLSGQGAEVDTVVAKSPAASLLAPGDVIVAFDTMPITTNEALVSAIHAHHSGDRITMMVKKVSPPGTVTLTVTLGAAPADPSAGGPPRAFLGISTATKLQPSLPVNVSIDPGNIGGPSAGLAFTLGVINDLVVGDITGGKSIAVTGAINPDSTVGDVGGVAQKTVAVRNAGAIAFLVPPGEYNEAVKHAGSHLKVIKVTSLDDALNALRNLGGDLSGIPPATAAAAG